MKCAARTNRGFSRRRGFWLRCFLGSARLSVLFGVLLCCSTHAQIAFPKPIHLTHVDGYVVNSQGKPVSNVEVTLVQDEKVAFSTRTDNAGAFHIDHVTGSYNLRVARSNYAPATREVEVGNEIVTHLERKKLYVIVGPGACMDECSSVFTSKHEFDRAILNKNRH